MPELTELASRLLEQTKDIEDVEVVIESARETEVRVYKGEIESLTMAESANAGIRVLREGKQGFATCGSLEFTQLLRALERARENADLTPPDPLNGLAVPDDVELPELDLVAADFDDYDVDTKVRFAKEMERSLADSDPAISDVQYCTYADADSQFVIASTKGLIRHQRRTTAYAYLEAIATDGKNPQTGFGYTVGRSFSQLDPDAAVSEAKTLALRMLGAVKPKSGQVTVVLDPKMTATFLSIIGGALSAKSVQRGRSIFTSRLGEKVASPLIDLIDNPTDGRFLAASTIDGEGLASRNNHLIVDGVLQEFLYDTYSAKQDGRASNACATRSAGSLPSPGPRSLLLRPGIKNQEAIISQVDNGILVQSMSGIHSGVNAVSGDFSVGVEGLRIKNGSLAEPVREATISSSLQRMLSEVIEVGNDIRFLPSIAAGQTLAIGSMSLGGS